MIIPMQNHDNILANSSSLLKAIIGCLNQLIPDSSSAYESSSPFNLRGPPTISIGDYLARMFKYMNCSLSTFVYSLVLLDRAQEYQVGLVLHRRNVHRLMLAASVIAAKYIDDFFYKNSYYANVGGVHVSVLNTLESEFLRLVNFNCHVEQETFQNYLQRLQIFAQCNRTQQGQKQNDALQKQWIEKRAAIMKKERKETDCDVKENSMEKLIKQKLIRIEADCTATVKE